MNQWWFELSPEQQSRIKRTAAIAAMLLLGLVLYYGSGRDEEAAPEAAARTELSLGTDLLEDDIRGQVATELQIRDEAAADQQRRLQAMETILAELNNKLDTADEQDRQRLADKPVYPLPPPSAQFPHVESQPLIEPPSPEVSFSGGISRVPGLPADKPNLKKKEPASVYLAPSFMPAMLLEGVEAITTKSARDNPEPIMLRVQAPAVLPNSLKADLKGCFVIANMVAELAKERVEGRLVSLHCLSHDGHAVIDADIRGHLTDADGKKGLAGITSSKMGSQISRALIANVFAGLGEAVTLDTVTQSTSALGTTQVIDSDRALQAGLGQGIKGGAAEVEEIFLELARQSGPVIEIGAAKKVWVVITEGVDLKIRERVGHEVS